MTEELKTTTAAAWACRTCTFVNEDANTSQCMMCEAPRRRISKEISISAEDVFRVDINESLSARNGSTMSIVIEDLPASRKSSVELGDSVSNLHNMSFAEWEQNRKAWKCELCTYKNSPRFLLCGGCGVAEGTPNLVQDEFIQSSLKRLSLRSAQKYLADTVSDVLDDEWGETMELKRPDLLNSTEVEVDTTEEESSDEDSEEGHVLKPSDDPTPGSDAKSPPVTDEDHEEKVVRNLFNEEITTNKFNLKRVGKLRGSTNDLMNIRKLREEIDAMVKSQDAERKERDEIALTLKLWRNDFTERMKAEPNNNSYVDEEQILREQESFLEEMSNKLSDREKKLEKSMNLLNMKLSCL